MKTTKPRQQHHRRVIRKKQCRLCENKIFNIDFKDVELIKRFQTDGGKILPRRITGNCFKHQKMLSVAVKRARVLALVL